MNKSSENHQDKPVSYRGLTARGLAKAVFNAELPQDFIRTVPAQSLYYAVKTNGLHSSAALIELASLEQCRLLTDFDLWQGDRFNEDNFWEWLGLADEEEELHLLQKLLKFVDLKLIALMISRYVQVVVFDEPTEQPPHPGYHTPDRGFTWLFVGIEDSHRQFLLSRFMAVIFETSHELFYQLIGTQNVATLSVLEEDSFTERSKRLAAESIPERDYAYEINSPLNEAAAAAELRKHGTIPIFEDLPSIEPMLYESHILKPLDALFGDPSIREGIEAELSLIMNAAVVRWSVQFYEQEAVMKMADKVKGALNIGLQSALGLAQLSPKEIYESIGLRKLYRLGLSKILALQKEARRLPESLLSEKVHQSLDLTVVAALKEAFPEFPLALKEETKDDSHLPGGTGAFSHLSDVELARRKLEEIGTNLL